ncbi:6723_t:CDS:2 [Rhizophagus irregularis]|nr:6723_t:CDS:2 [Rhizophagus irregularis]
MQRTGIMQSVRRISSTHGMETICGTTTKPKKKAMTNVHTLNDINKELKEKLYSALKSKAEINDLSEKLVDKYNKREKEFENKASQLIASSTKVRSQLISERKSHSESQRELEVKYTAEIQSLKSEIKTLKRKVTLAQKVSSANKVQILSLETKIRELEGKLEDIDLERTYHDLDITGGVVEEPAQISSFEIESLRLELERANEDRNSKEYTIECMEKGIEATHEITSQEIDSQSSKRLKLMEENRSLKEQLALKKNTSFQIISSERIPLESGGAEAVPLSQEISLTPVIPIVASSLMLPMTTYSMLALLLIVVIWLVVRKW